MIAKTVGRSCPYLPPSCSEVSLQEEGLICASGTAGVQSYEEDDRYKNMFE